MNISFLRNLMTAAWMMSPQAIGVALPYLNGILSGLEFDRIEPEDTSYVSASSSDSNTQDKQIAIQTIAGVMLKHDQECGPVGIQTIARRLLYADAKPDIIGHILIFDTGGGASDSVPALADAIAQAKKPVVALIDGCACSAGIYAASYCDHIIANNAMDMIGCVGVMIQFAQFPKSTTLEDGRNYVRIYADPSEEKNKDFEDALKGDFKLIKDSLLNPLAELFQSEMKKNRPGVNDKQLKGATYFAQDVVGSFIDEIGSMETAINKVISLSTPDTNSNSTQNNQMELTHLETIPSCNGLVVHEGSASLTEDQLADINTALENAASVPGLNTQIEGLNGTISTHVATIATHVGTISTKDARIVELEAALVAKPGAAAPSATEVVEDPHNSTGETEQSSEDYCRTHLTKHQ